MRINRIAACMMTAVLAAGLIAGCGESAENASTLPNLWSSIPDDAWPAPPEQEEPEQQAEADIPEGMYLSELTNEPIDESLKDQRPAAFMIDNDSRALPHFGIQNADVIYELMNSTANNRITRLMCLFKDWEAIEKVGSIRSVRPTNIILASEWNAFLCHDGGPFYIDEYFAKGYMDHFSGTFSRVSNGKSLEFTEFCLTGDLDKNFNNNPSVSRTYNSYKPSDETHFNFVPYGTETELSDKEGAIPCTEISFPFYNSSSKLVYNEDTKTYDYWEYGAVSEDGQTGDRVTFKNAIVQDCSFHQYDDNGYMIYNVIQSNQPGYYLTDGYAIPITWTKEGENEITRFYDVDNNEIQINTGKTYVTLIPSDTWSEVSLSGGDEAETDSGNAENASAGT